MFPISVIIPVYNGEHTLSATLDSLINQTYKNFEVVIVDDGSIDNTKAIINRYSKNDDRIQYYFQENAGVSMARNKGIELSRGDYVCFLDSDDYYEATYLEKMFNRLIETNYTVCYCGYNIATPHATCFKRTRFKDDDILLEYILGKVNVHTTGWMIKRSFLIDQKIRFPKGVSWGEDFEFFCEVLAKTNKVCYVDEYLSYYKVGSHENRLSAFSMDKIDKDYESIKRLVNIPSINKDKKIIDALVRYRLQALIVYRLLEGLKRQVGMELILHYYNRYRPIITKPSFNNGLRSVKLNFYKTKLYCMVRKQLGKHKQFKH